MPETDFIGMPEDEERIIRHAFKLGMEIVPDLRYESRDLLVISEWEPYKRLRDHTNQFFLFSDETLLSPFQTGELKERGEYYIMQRFGGPYVSFVNYSPHLESGVTIIPGGSISYYPSYYNSSTGIEEKPPVRFTELYGRIRSEIKRGASRAECRCINGVTKVYWLTTSAREALESGARSSIDGLIFQLVLPQNGVGFDGVQRNSQWTGGKRGQACSVENLGPLAKPGW